MKCTHDYRTYGGSERAFCVLCGDYEVDILRDEATALAEENTRLKNSIKAYRSELISSIAFLQRTIDRLDEEVVPRLKTRMKAYSVALDKFDSQLKELRIEFEDKS